MGRTETEGARNPQARFRRRRDVRFRLVDGEAVVLRQDAGETLVLNAVGSRILELLDRGEPIAELRRILVREFETSPEEVARDVESFVDELRRAGILEEHDGS